MIIMEHEDTVNVRNVLNQQDQTEDARCERLSRFIITLCYMLFQDVFFETRSYPRQCKSNQGKHAKAMSHINFILVVDQIKIKR